MVRTQPFHGCNRGSNPLGITILFINKFIIMKNIQKIINITELEVIKAQEMWAQNIIEIGNLYIKNEDYKKKRVFLLKNFMLLILVRSYLSQH